MSLEIYLTYLLTVGLLVMVPGPVVGLVVAIAGARGIRPALAATAGASLSIALQLTAAALGLASILALLGEAFEILRWLCTAYLVVMAVRLWRAPAEGETFAAHQAWSGTASFLQGFLVSSTNPKSLVFFAAFFPQFIDAGGNVGQQLLILTLTFQAVFTLGVTSYGMVSARLGRLAARPSLAKVRNRALSLLLGGAALGLATLRR